MAPIPTIAFVLAAGLGTRMRPLTDRLPKPLVPLAGRALLDHALDRIAAAGIADAVVNVHYMADQIEAHLAARGARGAGPRIRISNERALLLDTGGGARNALSMLGHAPFLIHNSDTVWLEPGDHASVVADPSGLLINQMTNRGGVVPKARDQDQRVSLPAERETGLARAATLGTSARQSNLARLVAAFDATRMDALLLLAKRETSLGYSGRGDFTLDADGRLARPTSDATVPGAAAHGTTAPDATAPRTTVPFVFAGASMTAPRLLRDTRAEPFSLNRVWDRALAEGRLFGLELDGTWMHVGDPEALAAAERLIADASAS